MTWRRTLAALAILGGLVLGVRLAHLFGALGFIFSGNYQVPGLVERFADGPVEVYGATLFGTHAAQRERIATAGDFYRKPNRLGINPMPGAAHFGVGGNPLGGDAAEHARLKGFLEAYLETIELDPQRLALVIDRHLAKEPFDVPVDNAYVQVTGATWEILFSDPLTPEDGMLKLDQLLSVGGAGVVDFSLGFFGAEGLAPGPSAGALGIRRAFVERLQNSPRGEDIARFGREHGVDEPHLALFNTFLLTHTGMTRGSWVLHESLVLHPEYAPRLQTSLASLQQLGPHGDGKFAHDFLLEAFRRRPPIGMTWMTEPDGQAVGFHLPAIGLDPTRYSDPMRFDPSRDNRDVLAWGGLPEDPRSCLAKDLSKAVLLTYFERSIARDDWQARHAAQDRSISYPFGAAP